jgi:hypothetical protein
MAARRLFLRGVMVFCAVGTAACKFNLNNSAGNGFGSGDPEYDRPPEACAPAEVSWSAAVDLHGTTEDSVHELITCGGLQVRLAQQIMAMVVASNEELLRDEEQAFVAEYLENPFTQTEDGYWTMEIPDSPTSSFTLAFHEPGGGRLITEDVFDVESYLEGAHVQSTLSFEEMWQNPTKKNVFTYTWETEGPLAHLMNDGDPIPETFDLELSLIDLIQLGFSFGPREPADFGPFNSVLDVELDSVVEYDDERSGTTVTYTVRTLRESMHEVASSAALAFEVETITATDGKLDLEGDAGNLRFVSTGTLAGSIEYSVTGSEVDLVVTSDFGEGASYPEIAWSCP